MKKIWPLLLLLLLLIFLCTLQKMDTIKVTKGSIDFSIEHTEQSNKISGHFSNIKQKQVLKNLFKQLHAPVTLSSSEDNTRLADFGGINLTKNIVRSFTKNYTQGEIAYQNKILTVKGKVKSAAAMKEMEQLLSDANITTKNLTVLDEAHAQRIAEEKKARLAIEKQKAEAAQARVAAKKAALEKAAREDAQRKRVEAQRVTQEAAARKARLEADAAAQQAASEAQKARLDAQAAIKKAAQEAEEKIEKEALKAKLDAQKVALEAQERRKAEVEKARLDAQAATQKAALAAEEARKAEKQAVEVAKKKAAQEAEAKANIVKLLKVENIAFNTAKTTLSQKGQNTVNKLSAILKKYADIHIEIAGHTDADGSEKFNQKLSQSRVDTVKNELVEQGIEASRLTAKGYGESKPLVPNNSDENKQKNRRVEINIIGE